MMVRSGWFWVRFWTARHSRSYGWREGTCPGAARGAPAPKERGVKHTVKKSISITLFEFNAFILVRSGLVRNPG